MIGGGHLLEFIEIQFARDRHEVRERRLNRVRPDENFQARWICGIWISVPVDPPVCFCSFTKLQTRRSACTSSCRRCNSASLQRSTSAGFFIGIFGGGLPEEHSTALGARRKRHRGTGPDSAIQCPRWYGCPFRMVNARYSCSSSITRASSCAMVIFPRDSTKSA